MKRFILQKITLPTDKQASKKNLFFKKYSDKLDFRTYFNILDIHKWKQHTIFNNLFLHIETKGSCNIVVSEYFSNSHSQEYKIERLPESKDIEITYHNALFLGISLTNLSENFHFLSGYFYTLVEEHAIKSVNLSIAICTFKREQYLLRNLKAIQNEILENNNSILHNHLEVFVADNGDSILTALSNQNIKPNKHIQIHPNINAGGTAGFTRCIIEILNNSKQTTHILLMDDDVSFESESIERTASFLSLIKDDYKKDFIGGAMLKEENPSIQHENGATWSIFPSDQPQLNKKNTDLSDINAIMANAEEGFSQYNAWFYCCMPINTILEKGLPLPFFIHYDDIEYGIRCKKNIIHLNGICVWHPTENKYSPNMQFYDTRNSYVTSILWNHDNKLKIDCLFTCLKRFLDTMTTYRYLDWSAFYFACKEVFCNSKKMFLRDPVKLHKKINLNNYKTCSFPYHECEKQFISDEKGKEIDCYFQKIGLKQILDILFSLVTLALPTIKDDLCLMNNTPPFFHPFFRNRKTVYVFNKKQNCYYILKKSIKKSLIQCIQFIYICIIIFFNYNSSTNNIKNQFNLLSSIDFWNNYLHLSKQ